MRLDKHPVYKGKTALFHLLLGMFLMVGLLRPVPASAQSVTGWQLDKMPADLETDFALSALPARLRAGATVYLLDPAKGYYVGRRGSNGFICFVTRTNWEWSEFRKDVITPMGYDPQGVATIWPLYRDVAAMRATGRFSPGQIKDTVMRRIGSGYYRAPSKAGVSYMLAPLMRVYTGKPGDRTVKTMSMPHYMFYAPHVSNADLGIDPNSATGPVVLNSADVVLGNGKGTEGYIIMAAGPIETAKIMADGKDLLRRLAAYSPYLKLDGMGMDHRRD